MNPKGKPFSAPLLQIFLLAIIVLSVAGGVCGSEFKSGDITISSLHVIDDDLYVYGNTLDLDGRVEGDLLAFAFKTTIRGEVANSVLITCMTLSHRGAIDGSLRVCANEVDIEGTIGRSAEVLASQVRFGAGSVVQRDINVTGGIIRLEGSVLGKARLNADKVIISGNIEQDVEIEAGEITIAPSAIISGNLTYTTPDEGDLTVEDGADIHGEIIPRRPDISDEDGAAELILEISYMFAAFIFGIIVVRLFRPYAEEAFSQLRQRYVTAFAAGLLGLVVLGLCVLVLLLALAAFGTGWLMLYSDSSVMIGALFLVFSTLAIPISAFATVSGSIIYYSGNILIAFLLGYLIVSQIKRGVRILGGLTLIFGLITLLVVYMIPYIGTLLYLVCSICGAGAIFMGIRHCRREKLNDLPPA